jgi:hypothetical protein
MYEQEKKFNVTPPKFSFGKEERKIKDLTKEVPGPGSYEIKACIPDVPKYVIPNEFDTKIHL